MNQFLKTYRNHLILWARDLLINASAALASTAVLSAFLLYAGMTEKSIGAYFAIVPVVNLVVSLLYSSVGGKKRKSIPAYTVCCLFSAILTAGYVLLSLMDAADRLYFPVLLVIGGALSAFGAIRTVYDYQMPCEVMDLRKYSMHISVGGILNGCAGIGCGLLLSLCFARFPYLTVARGTFLTAGACLLVSSAINLLLKPLPQTVPAGEGEASARQAGFRELWHDRSFRLLLLPNVLRGCGAGVTSMIMVLAVRAIGLAESDSAMITTCTYLATFLSCVLYGVMTPKMRVSAVGVIGAVLFCLLVPAFSGGRTLFFVLYAVSYIGFNFVCNALPDLVYRNVNPEIMGIYHTWRLALTTLGTTLATALIGAVIDKVSPTVILLVGAGTYAFTALAYALVFQTKKYDNPIK